jgi:hypothetical protein
MNEISEEKADCSTCIHYDFVLGIKPVCQFWLVGFDMRGYEPCDEYKKKRKNSDNEDIE